MIFPPPIRYIQESTPISRKKNTLERAAQHEGQYVPISQRLEQRFPWLRHIQGRLFLGNDKWQPSIILRPICLSST